MGGTGIVRGNKYSIEEAENIMRARSILKGRIIRYDRDRGYGFIYKKSHGVGREVYFRKDDFVSNTNSTKARVGSKVDFTLDVYDGKVCARNVKVTGHIYDGHSRSLEFPNGWRISYKSILKFGKSNCYLRVLKMNKEQGISEEDFKKNLDERGYTVNDFNYVFIRTLNSEYKIFSDKSPILGDGRVPDLDDYLKFLTKELLMIEDYVIDSSIETESDTSIETESDTSIEIVPVKCRKPKNIEEVEKFIFDSLVKEYGDNVISKKPGEHIVIDTETDFHGNSDVWINMNYFH